MTNSQKAEYISKDAYMPDTGFNREDLYDAAMDMAQWKDKEFNEERKEMLGLVKMLPVNENNQTIIEDLIGMLE